MVKKKHFDTLYYVESNINKRKLFSCNQAIYRTEICSLYVFYKLYIAIPLNLFYLPHLIHRFFFADFAEFVDVLSHTDCNMYNIKKVCHISKYLAE